MFKGPVLNFSVLHISVYQNRPNRGHKVCLKKVLKILTKKTEDNIGPINVKVQIFIFLVIGPISVKGQKNKTGPFINPSSNSLSKCDHRASLLYL